MDWDRATVVAESEAIVGKKDDAMVDIETPLVLCTHSTTLAWGIGCGAGLYSFGFSDVGI